MLVGADAVMLPPLPEVHRAILMAQDRMDHLPTLALELLKRRGPRVLVLHRCQGDRHAHHPPNPRPPHPGAADHRLGLDAPPRGLESPDAPALHLDARDLGLAVELRAA